MSSSTADVGYFGAVPLHRGLQAQYGPRACSTHRSPRRHRGSAMAWRLGLRPGRCAFATTSIRVRQIVPSRAACATARLELHGPPRSHALRRGIYGGQTHSQPGGMFTHVCGLRTVMRPPLRRHGPVIASIECDDPVIFLSPSAVQRTSTATTIGRWCLVGAALERSARGSLHSAADTAAVFRAGPT